VIKCGEQLGTLKNVGNSLRTWCEHMIENCQSFLVERHWEDQNLENLQNPYHRKRKGDAFYV
jgi:hypothetical protein